MSFHSFSEHYLYYKLIVAQRKSTVSTFICDGSDYERGLQSACDRDVDERREDHIIVKVVR